MLQALFGNKNLERILLFLFVNERCYGAQIQTLLNAPLTPVQKALSRLEKNGVLYSVYEGKTRIYQFNPSYPLRNELELLLRKAYTLLPSQEKKGYCFIQKPRLQVKEERKRNLSEQSHLQTFWQRLSQVKQLHFSAKSKQGNESTLKMGKARVEVQAPDAKTLIFQEKGFWMQQEVPDGAFSNMLRWTVDIQASLVSLEHLRYGSQNPVFLLHLAPKKLGHLESVDAHLCAHDTYLGQIVWDAQAIRLYWRIIGPQKNEVLIHSYS
jgi:predicted transcriptional regulator